MFFLNTQWVDYNLVAQAPQYDIRSIQHREYRLTSSSQRNPQIWGLRIGEARTK